MQFQSDVLGVPLLRPGFWRRRPWGRPIWPVWVWGFWSDVDEIRDHWQADREFRPAMATADVDELLIGWRRALERSKGWLRDPGSEV